MNTIQPNKAIVTYIREARLAGLSDLLIKQQLVAAGWSKAQVLAGFAALRKTSVKVVSPPKLKVRLKKPSRKRLGKLVAVSLLLVLLGAGSAAWLAYQRIVVRADSLFGYSLIKDAFDRLQSSSDWYGRLIYTDPAAATVRQGTATITLKDISVQYQFNGRAEQYTVQGTLSQKVINNNAETAATYAASLRPAPVLEQQLLTAVTFGSLQKTDKGYVAHYTALLDPSVFSPHIQTVNTSLDFGHLTLPGKAVSELYASWAAGTRIPVTVEIDVRKRKVVRLRGESSAFSLVKASAEALAGALPDSQTQTGGVLSQAQDLHAALENYKASYGGFPQAANGQAVGIVSEFLQSWPKPAPATACSDYYNEFTYTPEGAPSRRGGETVYPSYSITFCLPEDSGSYKAGIGIINPGGILTSTTCPSGISGCFTKTVELETAELVPGEGAKLEVEFLFQ